MGSVHNPMSFRREKATASWEMWPFNKHQIGDIQKYGTPVLLDPKEYQEDMYGFCGDLYCPNCGTKSDFMLIEFQKPSAEMMAAWMEINPDEIDEDLLRCPKCGHLNLQPTS